MMKKAVKLAIILFIASVSFAKLQLPAIFSDNMLIQRNSSVNIWGYADAGEKIGIIGDCMVKPVTADADKDGKWSASFESVDAGGPYTLTITSPDEKVEIKNILCGDVWLCSGQSNMAWSVERADNSEAEIKAANYPNIRLFKVPTLSSPDKQVDISASWAQCSPESVASFSAVAYFFARHLHTQTDVPIGVVQSAVGGSKIETWTPIEGYKGLNHLSATFEQIKQKTPGTDPYNANLKKAIDTVEKWQQEAIQAAKTGKSAPKLAEIDLNLPQGTKGILGFYNGMIHPIVPYTLKGAIWYQGESNNGEGMLYYERKKALINGWREIWGQGDFPFYFVQLAPYRYGTPETLPYIWEAQLYSLNIPNTGMAVVHDIGNYTDIHPRNKQGVGKRLALWALAKDYGKDIVYSGPLFAEAKFEARKAIVTFSNVGKGLQTRDGKSPDWFELAEPGGEFVKAQAKITGKDTVEVFAPQVRNPQVVRMGWDQSASPNLTNSEKLPASPFSSDIEQRILPKSKNLALNKPYECSDPNPHSSSWRQGLNNGSWAQDSLNCFATGSSSEFPKFVTIDLEKIETISKVRVGAPSFGSTKTIAIELSQDGENFITVGEYVFSQKRNEEKMFAFEPMEAKYLRLSYLDYYPSRVNYPEHYMFTTELEAYEY